MLKAIALSSLRSICGRFLGTNRSSLSCCFPRSTLQNWLDLWSVTVHDSLCLFCISVPSSVAKKPRNRNIFSSFFCCFGAQSTAAAACTVAHTNHNHNANTISEDTEPKVCQFLNSSPSAEEEVVIVLFVISYRTVNQFQNASNVPSNSLPAVPRSRVVFACSHRAFLS